MEFPLFNTKALSDGNTYNLNDPANRRKYFKAKLGQKIDDIKEYMDNNTFIAYFVAKKLAGKGTYSKLFEEIFTSDRVKHLAIGDLVRKVYKEIAENEGEREKLVDYMNSHYRGNMEVQEAIEALLNKNQSTLLPNEFVLTLVKREILNSPKKSLFIDGLPRNLDQMSYALYFREIMGYRDDRDFFVLIDLPGSVIEERLKDRLVCPLCHTSRNLKLLPTKFVLYNNTTDKFELICDNEDCPGFNVEKLVPKEGDDLGVEAISERLKKDEELMSTISNLKGVPIIKLRNAIPVDVANETADDYEITPEYEYEDVSGEVKIATIPWVVKDDDGVDSYSLQAAAVVVSFVSQLHYVLFESGVD